MSSNKWWLTKFGAKLLSDLILFLVLSSDIPLGLYKLMRAVPLKYLMDLLASINAK